MAVQHLLLTGGRWLVIFAYLQVARHYYLLLRFDA